MSFQNIYRLAGYEASPDEDCNYEDDFGDFNDNDSGDDTEEASENEFDVHNRSLSEPLEIKEQMYRDKLANLKKQLDDLLNGEHPEYIRRVRKLEHYFRERVRFTEVIRDYMKECVDRDYHTEKQAAMKEYEEKKNDLKDNLISDFEDRRKLIEAERHSMELTGDSMDFKPTVTRKLRRRNNEPIPVVEKRRKATNGQFVVQLDDKEIENDLKLIARCKTVNQHNQSMSPNSNGTINSYGNSPFKENGTNFVEAKIEDGKLLYERRWYHRGQQISVEGRDFMNYSASIVSIANDGILIKKVQDGTKVKILINHLVKGKIIIKRRAN